VLVLLTCALPIVRAPRLLGTLNARLLAAPLLLGLATLIAIAVLDEWPAALFPRYLYPMLPLFALFAGWAWTQAGIKLSTPLMPAALCACGASFIWVYMAAAYYFTNVGAVLGIHAAPLT
jgi:hypothetical protein